MHKEFTIRNKMFDVFFQCFGEPNADENFEQLKRKAPHVQRVDNIEGIHYAHMHCADLSSTEMFYLIDGDCYIKDDFIFTYDGFTNDKTYLWLAEDAVYKTKSYHGSLKLFSKKQVLNAEDWGEKYIDSTLTISDNNLEVFENVACEHRYNTTPLNTWRSIFREYIKQVSKEKHNNRTQVMLKMFLEKGNPGDSGYRWYAKKGAEAADLYFKKYGNNHKKLMIINDYKALEEMFNNFNYLQHEK